jgi:hypothetical protein
MIRRCLSASSVFAGLTVFSVFAVEAQDKTILRVSLRSPAAACAVPVPDDSQLVDRLALLSQTSPYFDADCLPRKPNRLLEPPSRPQTDLRTAAPPDSTEDQLETMGASGFYIGRARQEVLEILREGNSCSAWYAEAEPELVAKFASLHFEVDEQGETMTLGEYDSGDVSYREPYVARAQENVGRGSIITLNAHGAFFQSRALAKLRFQGGPFFVQAPKPLHVADYAGGSLNAQVTTLLHEFGHIVGILPVDSGEPRAPLLSTQNTATLLRHCRKQIEASRDRTILMPTSLARLEQSARSQ